MDISEDGIKQIIWEYIQACPRAELDAAEIKHLKDWVESHIKSLQDSLDIEVPKLSEKVREALNMTQQALGEIAAARSDCKETKAAYNSIWWKLLLSVMGANAFVLSAYVIVSILLSR